ASLNAGTAQAGLQSWVREGQSSYQRVIKGLLEEVYGESLQTVIRVRPLPARRLGAAAPARRGGRTPDAEGAGHALGARARGGAADVEGGVAEGDLARHVRRRGD